jgi:uncharacterized phiE125 gp8 family phage protein
MIMSSEIDENMVWDVTTPPAIEPVSLEEFKMFARIDGNDEDSQLLSFLITARSLIEKYLNRALIEQTITLKMDSWPEKEVIELPRPPLISITAVETLNESDVATVYSSSNYYIIKNKEPGLLVLKFGVTPPQNTERYYGGYQVRYKAGYGSTSASVPNVLKDCIKQWAMTMYENRAIVEEPPAEVKALLSNYRIYYI